MDNSPYLDKPFVPLAVALRSMLAATDASIFHCRTSREVAAPAEGRGVT
jgi:hypothetical protein